MGLGEASVYFALLGADVTALDLSPGMVDCVMALGRAHGVSIRGLVQSGERLRFVPCFQQSEEFLHRGMGCGDLLFAKNMSLQLQASGKVVAIESA